MSRETGERKVSLPRTRARQAGPGGGLCQAQAVAGLSRHAQPTARGQVTVKRPSATALRGSGPQRQGTRPSRGAPSRLQGTARGSHASGVRATAAHRSVTRGGRPATPHPPSPAAVPGQPPLTHPPAARPSRDTPLSPPQPTPARPRPRPHLAAAASPLSASVQNGDTPRRHRQPLRGALARPRPPLYGRAPPPPPCFFAAGQPPCFLRAASPVVAKGAAGLGGRTCRLRAEWRSAG